MVDSVSLEPAEVVLRFLESVGRRSDAEFYLGLFRAAAKERFACLCVDGPVIHDALDAVVLDLRFLAALGLLPVVVLGLFDPAHAGLHAETLARVTGAVGVATRLMSSGPHLQEAIVEATRDGFLPIVPFNDDTGSTEIARFAAIERLVLGLRTQRLMFLQRRGGLREDGKLVPLVNLTHDYADLVTSPELSRKQRFLLTACRSLVCEEATHKLTVAITSPLELLRELFTVKGAGTLLRRGARFTRRSGFGKIDKDRLRNLLNSAFRKPVAKTFFARAPWRVYVDDDYLGAAVVVRTDLGSYLSKFAVEREAQGEGIGGDLWDILTRENPRLFWRSRQTNPIDAWYIKKCDGFWRAPAWNVFWKGFAAEDIAAAVSYALAQPNDFAR